MGVCYVLVCPARKIMLELGKYVRRPYLGRSDAQGFAGQPTRPGVHLPIEEVLWCIEQFVLLTAGEEIVLVHDQKAIALDPTEEWKRYEVPEDFGDSPWPLLPSNAN